MADMDGMDSNPDDPDAARAAVALLRDTATIRHRAQALLERARSGLSDHYTVDDAALDGAAALVADVTRERYPDLRIPYHSRWRHFEAGGIDRAAQLDRLLDQADPADLAERARSRIDLALVSVLLDAGAGPDWRYAEAGSGQTFSRSEGLGVASFHAYTAGLFSSDADRPLQADAAGLRALRAEDLAAAFQVSADNPLVGLEGRVELLHRLGAAMAAQPHVFGDPARPGGLYDMLVRAGGPVSARDILAALLDHLGAIWPAGNAIAGLPLGDCWRHHAVPGAGPGAGWMPFHKLSQWLAYSLLEPFEWAGIAVTGLDALTGLPEYRNGGLLLDAGVLRMRDAGMPGRRWHAHDEAIVEWRALTVALLDELAPRVRECLDRHASEMPLACVLEGGTWAAGRVLAQRLRQGAPPLNIQSDGTVF